MCEDRMSENVEKVMRAIEFQTKMKDGKDTSYDKQRKDNRRD